MARRLVGWNCAAVPQVAHVVDGAPLSRRHYVIVRTPVVIVHYQQQGFVPFRAGPDGLVDIFELALALSDVVLRFATTHSSVDLKGYESAAPNYGCMQSSEPGCTV